MSRALACLALLAAGCSSQWYPGVTHSDIARTEIVIRSDPTGAVITFDGRQQPSPAPIRIPVEYSHSDTLYERQSNHGAAMRESMAWPFQILTFPVWMVASFFHFKEELRRHEYGGNVHVIDAHLPGYDDERVNITLEGQGELPVDVKMAKSK